MYFQNNTLIQRIKKTMGWTAGGVHKRIDENRELLELLMREAPGFMGRNSWVTHWLKSNDEFFVELETLIPIEDGRFFGKTKNANGNFPRPFPANATVI